MWLVTTRGFYSVVADSADPDAVLVRARRREDLEALGDLLIDMAIEHTPQRDYAWRATVQRAQWETAASALAAEIDYPSFKSAVAARQGLERAHVYARVWEDLLELQRG